MDAYTDQTVVFVVVVVNFMWSVPAPTAMSTSSAKTRQKKRKKIIKV
jgi:hypothetical protein